jgi:hypothetical protein
MLTSAAALAIAQASARTQQAELGDVRLLGAPDGPAQSVVFEIVNESGSLAVSCQLLNDTGKALAVKVVRFRHCRLVQ